MYSTQIAAGAGPTPAPKPWQDFLWKCHDLCVESNSNALRDLIWTRLIEKEGPAIDVMRNEEPYMLLDWVLLTLQDSQKTVFWNVAFDLLIEKITCLEAKEDTRIVMAINSLTDVIESGRGHVQADTTKVRGALNRLVGDSGKIGLVQTLYGLKVNSRLRLLSSILRVIAVFAPADSVGIWFRFLNLTGFEDSVVPAYMGYTRTAGEKARDALPLVARALACRDRPDTLAVTLKSFATASYSDNAFDPAANALDTHDFSTLFAVVPLASDAKRQFIAETFKALKKLNFYPDLLPEWEATALRTVSPEILFQMLLADDLGNMAISVFKGLAWVTGQDARAALPLVARALTKEDRAERLALVLKSFHDTVDFDKSRLSRESRAYRRKVLDTGDFYSLFSLVDPIEKSQFISETFSELQKLNFMPDKLEAWKAATKTPMTGILWDAIDSPQFAKFPALHALLAPEFASADPTAYRNLVGLFINSEPLLMFAPRLSQQAMEFAPIDRFLYSPASVLKDHLTLVKEVVRGIRLRFVTPGGECVNEIAPDPQDILPESWRPADENALLSVIMKEGNLDIFELEMVASGLLAFYDSLNPKIPDFSTVTSGMKSIAFKREESDHYLLKGVELQLTHFKDAEEVKQWVSRVAPSARAKIYRPADVQSFDSSTSVALLAWLRENIKFLLSIQKGEPAGVYRNDNGLNICIPEQYN